MSVCSAGYLTFLRIRHGAQGVLDSASKNALENEFGTSNDDDCMVKILEGGEYQTSMVRSYSLLPVGLILIY